MNTSAIIVIWGFLLSAITGVVAGIWMHEVWLVVLGIAGIAVWILGVIKLAIAMDTDI